MGYAPRRGLFAIIITIVITFTTGVTLWASPSLSLVPVHGNGTVKVRIYSNYFCPPCQSLDGASADVLTDLVKGNVVSLTLIDLAHDARSALYVRYYLAATAGSDMATAVRVRHALVEAARMGITTEDSLRAHMTSRGYGIHAKTPPTPTAVLAAYNKHVRMDMVRSTPTAVIETAQGRAVYRGVGEIMTALNALKGGTTR